MTADLPTGTVTFLFTDIQGSSWLWDEYPDAMPDALARHDRLLRGLVEAHGGHVIKTTGDGLHAAFAQASAGVAAALAGQQALAGELWPGLPHPLLVRMGLHTGEAQLREGDYYGAALNRAARLMALACGGQTLLSAAVAEVAQDQLPPGAGLRSLGEHRLKDLVRPEHIFQLDGPGLPAVFPPLRSLTALLNNLPVQLTSFIGRELELAEARRLLSATRLLTLTGPGGTGKTRLSLQLAAEVLDTFPDGVWLVELAPLSNPALVPETVAAACSVRAQPGRPLLDTLADYLRDKGLLLILDNCEHLIDTCAQLAAVLLRAGSRLKLLASSREALGLAGETAYRVPSLSLPDPRHPASLENFSQSDAARLFVERAQAVQPGFGLAPHNLAAVTQICQRLDGIPLALELAAARVRLLSVEQIALRLDDRFRLLTGGSRTALPRQQTLRALIDWSYDILPATEKAGLARLSVFAGGWSLEAAEAVLGPDALDLLSHLVDKSLVVVDQPALAGEARYWLLETIRQYARDRLLESGEAPAARAQHLRHFHQLAAAAEPRLLGPQMLATMSQLETELDNLRAALDWTLATNPTTALQIAASLTHFWQTRGHLTEGRRWVQDTLARYEQTHRDAQPPPSQSLELSGAVEDPGASLALRAKGLWAAGYLAFMQGELMAARSLSEAGAALARAADAPTILLDALSTVGLSAVALGDGPAVDAVIEEGAGVARTAGYRQGQAAMLELQAERALRLRHDFVEAKAHTEASLQIQRELGSPWVAGGAIFLLAISASLEGSEAEARARFEEAELLIIQWGDQHAINAVRGERAHFERRIGRHAQALAFYAQTLAGWQELGLRPAVAHDLECVAFIACARSQALAAARLLGAAENLRASVNAPMTAEERAEYDQTLAALRAQLEAGALAVAWADGHQMTVAQAVAAVQEV